MLYSYLLSYVLAFAFFHPSVFNFIPAILNLGLPFTFVVQLSLPYKSDGEARILQCLFLLIYRQLTILKQFFKYIYQHKFPSPARNWRPIIIVSMIKVDILKDLQPGDRALKLWHNNRASRRE
jgi:hypothetical protein